MQDYLLSPRTNLGNFSRRRVLIWLLFLWLACHSLALLGAQATAQDFLNEGKRLMGRGDWPRALAAFNLAATADPKSEEAFYLRGIAKLSLGDHDGAIADLTRCLELNPKGDATVYFNRALARQKKQDLDGAATDVTRALELDPKDSDFFLLRGMIRNDQKNYAAAVADFDAALALDAKSFRSYYNRGLARHALGDPAKAIADFTATLELRPNLLEAYFQRSAAKFETGDLAGAEADLNRLLAFAPKDPGLYIFRGNIRRAQGNRAGAEQDYNQAIALTPAGPAALEAQAELAHLRSDRSHRIDFARATINGQPAALILDTGSEFSIVDEASAKSLGLSVSQPAVTLVPINGAVIPKFSEPVQLALGGKPVAVPLAVLNLGQMLPPENADDKRVRGIIGWPEVKDNLLHFDSAQRAVRHLRTLPADVAGWEKFSLQPGEFLVLRTLLADKGTGNIVVDTGLDGGVKLPPAQWKQWRAAHPDAPIVGYKAEKGVAAGTFSTMEEVWADEITLGQLVLKDVPVSEMNALFFPWLHPAAALGLYALNRMELVVDGPNGQAYIKPLPSSAVTYRGFKNAKAQAETSSATTSMSSNLFWIMVDPLELRPGHAWLIAANSKILANDYAAAMAYFNRAIELDPTLAFAHARRGELRQLQGDLAGALTDYDRAIELAPEDTEYTRLFREVVQLQLKQAPTEFSKQVAAWKNEWAKTLGLYLAETINEAALREAAGKDGLVGASVRQAQICYYIGIKHLLAGDLAGARESFQQLQPKEEQAYFEYLLARAELAKLPASTQKP